MKIGVLSMQGDIEEHLAMLEKLRVESIRVKSKKDLDEIDGLIIPGGESTTMLKLLKIGNLFDTIKQRILDGFPVYGTCAGLILLANEVSNPAQDSLKVLDVSVNRNGYGRQIDSFYVEINVPIIGGKPFKAVFIRAPIVTKTGRVDILAQYNGHAIFVREKNVIASTFHPEISGDARIHEFFLGMVKNAAHN